MAPISKRTYRKQNAEEIERMKQQGIKDIDVCHIISRSNGGASSSRNYILANAAFNKQIGDQWDHLMMYVAFQKDGLDRVRKAIQVSPKAGYSEDKAQSLVDQGREEWVKRQLKYETIIGGTPIMESGVILEGTPIMESGIVLEGGEARAETADKPGEKQPAEIDGSKICEPGYAKWVLQIWRIEGEKSESDTSYSSSDHEEESKPEASKPATSEKPGDSEKPEDSSEKPGSSSWRERRHSTSSASSSDNEASKPASSEKPEASKPATSEKPEDSSEKPGSSSWRERRHSTSSASSSDNEASKPEGSRRRRRRREGSSSSSQSSHSSSEGGGGDGRQGWWSWCTLL